MPSAWTVRQAPAVSALSREDRHPTGSLEARRRVRPSTCRGNWLTSLAPMRVLPLYRLFLGNAALDRFPRDARDIEFGGHTNLDGELAYILNWQQEASSFLGPLHLGDLPMEGTPIPVTAWVSSTNHMVLRLKMDLSPWARELLGEGQTLPVTGLTVTESHRYIQAAPTAASPERPRFEPPASARQVRNLNLPPANLLALASPQRKFLKSIPRRLPQAAAGDDRPDAILQCGDGPDLAPQFHVH